ncbi:hypothetical protein, partial [Spiroplasma phoeniceum]|uniref:hypothetical protein n=1 Tax=Spiroplasma phoeniceum TaxID=47835 RepID=UPI0033650537
DNPYTNNEEDYLRLSVWSFRGKTKSILNNYLRDMTTNYKTSFLLPHDYEIPTFNYPQYVLPPVPYNYQPYTKDIWDANTIQPLKTKITAPVQCKKNTGLPILNLFNDDYNYCYYEIEIDLKQVDPTIQSIDKFISSYKTIEISNLNNLQVECGPPDIEKFISNRDINLLGGYDKCNIDLGSLDDITLLQNGRLQIEKINFGSIFTINDTKEIPINGIKTFDIWNTYGLSGSYYEQSYKTKQNNGTLFFLPMITKLNYDVNRKIEETYLQAYYTNDLKLKIRFSKVIIIYLWGRILKSSKYYHIRGNDKNITIDINNENVLGIRNNNNSPDKIRMKPRK